MTTNSFNFDRCLKFVFYRGDLGTEYDPVNKKNVPIKFVVEYNPRKASYLCPKLEATITDTPASSLKDRVGYEAQLKIYNPNHDILQHIASGIAIIGDKDVEGYYKGKLKVAVYAGYYVEAPKKEITDAVQKNKEELPKDNQGNDNVAATHEVEQEESATYTGGALFDGYVNNSIFIHKGTDNILTLSCHDIDLTANQLNQIRTKVKDPTLLPEWSSEEMDELRYKPNQNTFDASFRWLVKHLSEEWYPPQYSLMGPKAMSAAEKQYIPLTINRDTMDSSWFDVVYVHNPSAFKASFDDFMNTSAPDRSTYDENLRVRATDPNVLNPVKCKNFYTLKARLSDALNDLCAYTGERLGYVKYDLFGKIIFCVYKRENRKNTVSLNTKGVIKIINFQNLLEAPTVTPGGSLNINMWFNRDCEAWKHIALVLDSTYTGDVGETGILNLNKLNFTTMKDNQLIVPLGGSTSNAAVATTQLSTSMPVAAVSHMQKLAAKNGYMFNTPFLITKVTHKLSTHGKNWSTTVQTVPFIFGSLNNESA